MLFETVYLECHQQRSFTLKMHQNRWWLGLRPLWELTALPRPLVGLRELLLRGGEKEGRGKEANRRKGEATGGEAREGLWTLTMLETD